MQNKMQCSVCGQWKQLTRTADGPEKGMQTFYPCCGENGEFEHKKPICYECCKTKCPYRPSPQPVTDVPISEREIVEASHDLSPYGAHPHPANQGRAEGWEEGFKVGYYKCLNEAKTWQSHQPAPEKVTDKGYTKEQLRNMLEDVVNELDLSETMIEKHGPLGTPPAELVKLVIGRKDLEIKMLKSGFKTIGQESRLPDSGREEQDYAFGSPDSLGQQDPQWIPIPQRHPEGEDDLDKKSIREWEYTVSINTLEIKLADLAESFSEMIKEIETSVSSEKGLTPYWKNILSKANKALPLKSEQALKANHPDQSKEGKELCGVSATTRNSRIDKLGEALASLASPANPDAGGVWTDADMKQAWEDGGKFFADWESNKPTNRPNFYQWLKEYRFQTR